MKGSTLASVPIRRSAKADIRTNYFMSTTAISLPPGSLRFWQTTVGKKAVMAITGVIMFGFLVGHLLGNLQLFLGAEKLNHYAMTLRSLPALVWGTRIILLISVALHIW